MDRLQATVLARPLAAAVAVVVALLVHVVLWRVVLRTMRDRELAQDLHRRCRWPSRAVVALTAAVLVLPGVRVESLPHGVGLHRTLLLALVAAAAWLTTQLIAVAENAFMRHYDVTVPDNLRARRVRTQVRVLARVATLGVVMLALATMLLTFPEGRTLGASLLASAGIAGVLAGIAARSTVGNLIAGLQIAFAEPIRLDDAVVVEGEWGHVEEITLTYVIVRLWDRRRLVLPCSYFVENPIENWTRYSADIVGTVYLHVDYTTPVEEVRAEFERILETSTLWNRQTAVLQVVDTSERTMLLRALVSAANAPDSWDLRCEVRERLLAWLQREHPEALPRLRGEVRDPTKGAAADGSRSRQRARRGSGAATGGSGPR
jgi:small-conductance mechanosensitive channel